MNKHRPTFRYISTALAIVMLISACSGSDGRDGEPGPAGPQGEPGPAGEPAAPEPNTLPIANSQSLSANENTPLDITLSGSDDDGESLSFTIVTGPTNGVLTGTAPDLTYTADTDYIGNDSFSFMVNDGSEDSATASVNITINPFYFSIGGTVTGLVDTGLFLENNGKDNLEVAGTSFTFPNRLGDGSNYDVTVAGQPEHQLCRVDSSANGTVAGADVDDISVLCRSWRTAALIENDPGEAAISSQIAFNSSGNAVAVWIQSDGAQDNVWANTYSPDAGWGTAELIESDNAGNAADPQIAVDSAGSAIAVWHQWDGAANNIYVNHYSAATASWGTEVPIESDNGYADNPEIAFDSAGNAIAVWTQDDGTRFNIHSNRYSADSASWGSAELIESNNGGTGKPRIAFDSAGNAIAVWNQEDGTTNSIYANRYSADTGVWGSAALIENDAGAAVYPELAVDSAGNAIVVWVQYGGTATNINIHTNRYSAATARWGTAELIDSSHAGGDAAYPQIAVDSTGNAIAIWYRHDGGTQSDIYANRYSAATASWGAAQLIESSDTGGAELPQIVVDSAGNAIAVWRQSDGVRYSINANRYSAASADWGTAQLIESDDAGSAGPPQIAIDSTGIAIALWAQSDGTHVNIYANLFE